MAGADAHRILVVDDEPDIGRLIGLVATSIGYAVRLENDGHRFADAYHEFAPHVIMLDLTMPGVDGIECLRFLAAARAETDILLMSGFDERMLEAARRLASAQGLKVAGIVPKPIDMASLERKLDQLRAAS
ncbi:response regulator [Desertibaculum subflavum]|uniref:response regulator n=1 Tax=Desertibaculum subflavum TaxID=2268458 RepID=UPI000E6676EF